jgi:predicted ATPase
MLELVPDTPSACGGELHLIEEANSIEVAPRDVGIGISQVIPVIVAALFVKNGILAIEQPELHVHPAFQVALGDLFISQINEKDVAFLLETHSEHLMLRLLRRIRETSEDSLPPGKSPLKPDDLGVWYVEQGQKGIALTPIRINEEGDFVDRWPKGFFGERMEELF